MKRQLGYLVVCIATMALLTMEASATVLYSDSFSRIQGSGDPNGKPADPNNFSAWGANDNALGGSAVNTWVVGPSRGGGANQVTNGNLASTIEGGAFYKFDATTFAPNGFSVEFDFNRFHPFNPGTGNGYSAVGIGVDLSKTAADIGGGAFTTNNADFALLFQQAAGGNTGNTQFFQDGAFLPGTGATGPVDYGNPTVGHNVLLKLIPAVAGQYGAADTINGSVSIDGGTPFNFSVLGGTDFGTLSFSSNGFVHRSWDNVIVRAIPEPMSIGLAGIIGMLGLVVRKRS